jgi:hypothetical protein
MKLQQRVAHLELGIAPEHSCVTIICEPGQTDEQATAVFEAIHGPIDDPRGDVLRVLINRFA